LAGFHLNDACPFYAVGAGKWLGSFEMVFITRLHRGADFNNSEGE
jgi:hypothetical protein